MKKTLLLLLAIICLSTAKAQLLWNKTYGTSTTSQSLNRMIPLTNGDYLLVGRQYTPTSSGSAINASTYTIRTNTNGDTVWTRKHLPPGCDEGAIYDAAEDPDGNLVLVGFGILGINNNQNGFILKLNSNGDTIWTKKFVSPQTDGYYNVIIGNDSTYIINCQEFGTNVIKKFRKNGTVKWTRPLVFSQTDAGFITNLSKTQNGYFVSMGTYSTVPSAGKTVLLNEAGVVQQSFLNFATVVTDVYPKLNNNLVACADGRVYEYNTLGDTLWSRNYKAKNSLIDLIAVKPTSDGNYIALFDRYNGMDMDIGLIKIAPDGTPIKDTVFFRVGFQEFSRDIAVDANGDYIFAGDAGMPGNKNSFTLAKLRKWNHTLGIKEDKELAPFIKVYPNPAAELVNLESKKQMTGTLSLNNLQGQSVWQETVTKSTQKIIPLQNLSSGIYILRFSSENGTQFGRKVIKL